MRRFGTQGPVNPEENYVVPRTTEIADFLTRVKDGKYIVLFAPRQTGKTTFFRWALDTLAAEDATYFPIQLDFQVVRNTAPATFYKRLYHLMRTEIEIVFRRRGETQSEALTQFLANTNLTDAFSLMTFFQQLSSFLTEKRVVVIVDEFDGIPQTVVSDFLYALRYIYVRGKPRCPHSVGIIGVKSIAQLDYDRSVSPFNIQDEFHLPNFTLEQVRDLLGQYTAEVGQAFAPEVIESIHKQTAGQPFLVNRFAQILTEELKIPKCEPITMAHFTTAHAQLLRGRNTNIEHLTTNIRKDPRFETLLMKIVSYDMGVPFILRNDIISELATYGVIKEGAEGMCEILNPIYQQCIMQTFQPLINGLEAEYFPENANKDFFDYLTPSGQVEMEPLLDNFKDFIARTGYRILQVPETPQEFVGQYLLSAYLDQFIRGIGGTLFLEVQTGRGRIDLLICHNQRKYIVETKIWEGARCYAAGKKQLAAYLKLEGETKGYYVVFDHRQNPEFRVETETLDGVSIRSYVIPVMQEIPSNMSDKEKENTWAKL